MSEEATEPINGAIISANQQLVGTVADTEIEDNGLTTGIDEESSAAPTDSSVSKRRRSKKASTGLSPSAKKALMEKVCPCEQHLGSDEVWVRCNNCKVHFHVSCVGLSGLSARAVKSLVSWSCINCFVPRFFKNVDGANADESSKGGASCNTIRLIVKEELNLVCNVMRASVKDATESAFQKKSKELVDTCQTTLKSYADVTKSAQESVIEKVTSVENSKKLVTSVVSKIDNDNMERAKRECNVVINNVPESRATDGRTRKSEDMDFLIQRCEFAVADIVSCFRAGKPGQKDQDGNVRVRPLVVRLVSRQRAQSYCNDGKGYSVEVVDEDTGVKHVYWINADLCQADREARFLARQERRRRTIENPHH